MSKIVDFMVDLGVKAIKSKIDENELRKRLTDHLERKMKHEDFQISVEEEIDFAGLEEYILTSLGDDINRRLFGNKEERAEARRDIIGKAVAYSNAHTKLAEKRVSEFINKTVDIVAKFYHGRVPDYLQIVAGEVEDEIIEDNEKTRGLVVDNLQKVIDAIKSVDDFSIENMLKKVRNGEITEVEDTINARMDAISREHTLYPNYGYRMLGNSKLVSYPLNKEASERYPAKYCIDAANVKVGEQEYASLSREALVQSYHHQLPIHVDVINAKKYLGDVLDPQQREAEEMIGSHMVITPPEFPKAFPCNVIVGDEIMVPYLLLRTKELLDDGTIIISNDEQTNRTYSIQIGLNHNRDSLGFTVQPVIKTNKSLLKYCEFLKAAKTGTTLKLFALEQDVPLISASVEQMNIEGLEDRIEIFRELVLIEERLNVDLPAPDRISFQEIQTIKHISDILKDGYRGTWKKFNFFMDMTERNRQSLLEFDNTKHGLSYIGSENFYLFGHEIVVPIARVFDGAIVQDLDHVKEKVKVCDEGDKISISIVPSEEISEGRYIDYYYVYSDEDIEDGSQIKNME